MGLQASDFIILEKTTGVYSCTFYDDASPQAVIPAASFTTLTMTLYDYLTGTIINSRDAQSVLNANQCTIDSSGNFEWAYTTTDTTLNSSTLGVGELEARVCLLSWTYNSGAKTGRKEIVFWIKNLSKVS